MDELPQLFNVLKGDMSLVGPRPEVPEYVAKYSERDRRVVLSVRPGLTDLASIRFRSENRLLASKPDPLVYYERVIIPLKLRYSRFYVRRAGPGLDLYIMALTARSLLADFCAAARAPWTRRPAPVAAGAWADARPLGTLRRRHRRLRPLAGQGQ
jgi:lipopolysaccharide/colanic/teichoic acid biosynthesis glycosyltransferase